MSIFFRKKPVDKTEEANRILIEAVRKKIKSYEYGRKAGIRMAVPCVGTKNKQVLDKLVKSAKVYSSGQELDSFRAAFYAIVDEQFISCSKKRPEYKAEMPGYKIKEIYMESLPFCGTDSPKSVKPVECAYDVYLRV